MKPFLSVLGIILIFLSYQGAYAYEFIFSAKEDLNGDGKSDSIELQVLGEVMQADGDYHDSGDYILRINSTSFEDSAWPPIEGFIIVDIDSSDKYKEVVVYSSGPSDDDEFCIYWYDGNQILKIDSLSAWLEFPGNSFIYAHEWLGWWTRIEKYVLDKKNRKLTHIPQELYYVGREAEVLQSFPIYKSRTDKTVVANLQVGSKATILVCVPESGDTDNDNQQRGEWFIVKTQYGICGWAREENFLHRMRNLLVPAD